MHNMASIPHLCHHHKHLSSPISPHTGRVLRVFAANRFTMPAELVLFFKNLLYLSSFASAVGPEVDLLDAVVGVVLELAEAHPEEFAAAELEEAAAG